MPVTLPKIPGFVPFFGLFEAAFDGLAYILSPF